jgi:uncharacterized protein with HEPN domain
MVKRLGFRPKSIGIALMFSDKVRNRLQDIIDNADWIEADLEGFDVDRFLENRTVADAVERCIERIAEAIVRLGPEATLSVGLLVPWHGVRNLGNRLRHEYGRIDRRVIFDTARNDIPPLREAATKALEL